METPAVPEIQLDPAATRSLVLASERRDQLARDLGALEARLGTGHRRITSLRSEISGLSVLIDAQTVLAGASPAGTVSQDKAEWHSLRHQKSRLEALGRQTNDDARRIGKLQLDIDRLREQPERANETYQQADARVESLLMQQRDGQQGRIRISHRTDMPVQPSTDRRVPLSVLGALLGMTLGLASTVAFGVARPSCRDTTDITRYASEVRTIGVIPIVDRLNTTPEPGLVTCIHQIRTTLEADRRCPMPGRTLLVTSASNAEGKSTVTAWLAEAFAASGRTTLIIDADFIGRQITSSFGLCDRPGFADAIREQTLLETLVCQTELSNLLVFPVGRLGDLPPENLSSHSVSMLLGQLRRQYDAILIDSGPILGASRPSPWQHSAMRYCS